MAVKVIRQMKKIALVGSASSAASIRAGTERAPAALRAAGMAQRFQAAGFEVTDQGDTATRMYLPDDEHPRAKNVSAILQNLNDLRPRVEVAVKSGALPLILAGDGISLLAVVAGVRRYYRSVRLLSADRDAGLNVPATTSSGCIDTMVISHVVGRGAPELIRFWGEPPLVREPDVILFGVDRLDPPEQQFLAGSSLRRDDAAGILKMGAAEAARRIVERFAGSQFVLHFDLDVISGGDFAATNLPATGGLSWSAVREALQVFVSQPTLAAIHLTGYNPDLDADGEAARRVVELMVELLSPRLTMEMEIPAPAEAAGTSVQPPEQVSAGTVAETAAPTAEPAPAPAPMPAPGPEGEAGDPSEPAG